MRERERESLDNITVFVVYYIALLVCYEGMYLDFQSN